MVRFEIDADDEDRSWVIYTRDASGNVVALEPVTQGDDEDVVLEVPSMPAGVQRRLDEVQQRQKARRRARKTAARLLEKNRPKGRSVVPSNATPIEVGRAQVELAKPLLGRLPVVRRPIRLAHDALASLGASQGDEPALAERSSRAVATNKERVVPFDDIADVLFPTSHVPAATPPAKVARELRQLRRLTFGQTSERDSSAARPDAGASLRAAASAARGQRHGVVLRSTSWRAPLMTTPSLAYQGRIRAGRWQMLGVSSGTRLLSCTTQHPERPPRISRRSSAMSSSSRGSPTVRRITTSTL